MSKSKPKTIADLNIKWTFSNYRNGETITKKKEKFKQDNCTISHYTIKIADYEFLIDDLNIKFSIADPTSIIDFIEWLNFEVSYLAEISNLKLSKELIKFELVSRNVFRIHLKD